MPIRDRNIEANKNDGFNPGISIKGMKNLIDADPDGYAAHDGLIRFTFPDGPTQSQSFTLATPGKLQIIDAWVVKTTGTGGASDTVQVLNGTTPVTDAMSLNNVANKSNVRAGQIDMTSGNNIVPDGGTVKVTVTKASGANVACVVFVNVARSA
jgi:hypothetical protein